MRIPGPFYFKSFLLDGPFKNAAPFCLDQEYNCKRLFLIQMFYQNNQGSQTWKLYFQLSGKKIV